MRARTILAATTVLALLLIPAAASARTPVFKTTKIVPGVSINAAASPWA